MQKIEFDRQNETRKQVTDLILKGFSFDEIQEFLTDKSEEPKAVIAEVVSAFESIFYSREFVQSWCMEALKETYKNMLDMGDFAGCIKAIKEINSLSIQIEKERTKTVKPSNDNDWIKALQ